MIKIYDSAVIDRSKILERGNLIDFEKAEKTVAEILKDVRLRGDDAVRDYTFKFDGCMPEAFEVGRDEIDEAFAKTDDDFIETLRLAAENIRVFHTGQLRQGFEIARPDGTVVGQRVLPVRRAGVYVPGGTAAYPSTVLMDVIPAAVAGVEEIVMVTPPDKNGCIRPEILAAARIAGVTEIYRIGGAQAVAALAYGTQTVRRVDKIVGPGNIYVAAAKRAVSGEVGIDMFAGPSEILIIADETARPDYLAADMLSQAEHDRLASAVLICTDRGIAEKTADAIAKRLQCLPRREIASASLETGGKIIIVRDLKEAAEISDALAPEHLEIMTRRPEEVMATVRNAGSIFLGEYSPEPIGDYFAGPNHTLPTSGKDRFSYPLVVDDFVKRSGYIKYSAAALKECGARVADFANREGLGAHAQSILARLDGGAAE